MGRRVRDRPPGRRSIDHPRGLEHFATVVGSARAAPY